MDYAYNDNGDYTPITGELSFMEEVECMRAEDDIDPETLGDEDLLMHEDGDWQLSEATESYWTSMAEAAFGDTCEPTELHEDFSSIEHLFQ
jgi:hypothetical protein